MKNSQYVFLYITILLLISNCTTAEIPLTEKPVTTITYQGNVKTIIDNNCTTCHVSGGVASFLTLVNYTEVRNSAENGTLIARMNDAANPMPQSGLLSAETRAVIEKWMADGFLEN
ncbi:MAG: hypothetical protein ACPGUU_08860 [Flavobacteriaceae bacterium]